MEPFYFRAKPKNKIVESLSNFWWMIRSHPWMSCGALVFVVLVILNFRRGDEESVVIPEGPPGVSAEAQAEISRGTNFLRSGNFAEANVSFAKAEFFAFRDRDLPALADAKVFVGTMDLRTGKLQECEREFLDVIKLRKASGDTSQLADDQIRLAAVYAQTGRQEESMALLTDALELKKKEEDIDGQADILHNMAALYDLKGDLDLELETIDEAIQLHHDADNDTGVSRDQELKGGLLCRMGQPDEGLAALEQARNLGDNPLAGNSLGPSNTDVILNECKCLFLIHDYAPLQEKLKSLIELCEKTHDERSLSHALLLLGALYDNLGTYALAVPLYQRASDLADKFSDSNLQAIARTALAEGLSKTGQPDQAIENLGEALEITKHRKDRQLQAVILAHRGFVEVNAGKMGDAADDLEDAVDLFEELRMNLRTAGDRSAFFRVTSEAYPALAYINIQKENYREAFRWIERGRAKSLLDMLQTRSMTGGRIENSVEVEDLERQLKNLEGHYGSTDFWRLALRRRLVLHDLMRKDPELGSLVEAAPPDLDEIQSNLGSNDALIEYYHPEKIRISQNGKDSIWIFVVTRDRVVFRSVQVETEKILETARLFLAGAADPYFDENQFATQSDKLYEWLFSPISGLIQGKRLLIVPWGPIYYLPLGAIYHDGYLAKQHEISVYPSAGVLPFMVKKRRHGTTSIMALGNPVTDAPSLPGSEMEAQEVCKLFPKSALYLREKATESLLKNHILSYDVLHLSTHGGFDPVEPMDSLVLLTNDDLEDGELTVHEIYQMDLRKISLVTLSACTTGEMGLDPGSDVVGLVQSFFFAGSPSVVASMWSVDDQATRTFMNYFYRAYTAGHSKSRSIQMAQEAMLDQSSFRAPFFWAAFQLFGDPE
jgi:CHAT domain-containing protein/tetratricopeptide (TPR) repeat protein